MNPVMPENFPSEQELFMSAILFAHEFRTLGNRNVLPEFIYEFRLHEKRTCLAIAYTDIQEFLVMMKDSLINVAYEDLDFVNYPNESLEVLSQALDLLFQYEIDKSYDVISSDVIFWKDLQANEDIIELANFQ